MIYLREEWIKHPKLKRFSKIKCTDSKCECGSKNTAVLWEHDSCVRGRIDTEVCLDCDGIKSFDIRVIDSGMADMGNYDDPYDSVQRYYNRINGTEKISSWYQIAEDRRTK